MGLGAGVLIISLALSVFLFKDKIVRQFIAEANKQLNTPIKVGEIDVSAFRHFPFLSIEMNDVYVEDSHPGEYPLLTAKRIAFKLHPWEVYRGIYNIKGLEIEDSETSLKINEQGKNNYTIVQESSGSSTGTVNLELRQVNLKNTKVTYFDLRNQQHHIFQSKDLEASINRTNDVYDIDAEGHVTTESISVEGKTYFAGKSFEIDTELAYDDNQKVITFQPSDLQLKKAVFSVDGTYGWRTENNIDLKVKGRDTDIQTLLSLLPESTAANFSKYKSKGAVYFSGRLSGPISQKEQPELNIDFGFTNATIYQPDYDSKIERANVKGSFSSPDLADASRAKLELRNITGILNGEPFKAQFLLRDLNNPDINCSFSGKVDAAALYGFYPVKSIDEVKGKLVADVSLKGKIGLLKNKTTAQQVSTHGTIELLDVNFLYGTEKIPLKNLKGSLQFSNNDLALSNVSARFGRSDFILNGFFKNVITYLLFDNQPVGIEADLKSEYVDVSELLNAGYGTGEEGANTTYKFDISKNVYLNFNCDIKKLKYRRFNAQDIRGDLLVKNKVAVSRNLSLKTMNGNVNMSGIVDANNVKAIDVVCSSRLNQIKLDSIFYVFENFDQDFIQDKHLKGNVTADVNFELVLSENLTLYQETLIADIGAVIKNGELNNFEPLKKLNKYLGDEGLSRLRFSDLQNDIHIEKKTVFIPQMEVRTNVTNIKISGTHTFDQVINYRLVAPLVGRKRFADNQAEGAIENDESGETKLFLKITGTTSDYKVGFDTDAVKKKIVSDLKKETRELKDAFKKRETQKQKEIEVQEDDYFEWSE